MSEQKDGAQLIVEERRRQLAIEGWTSEHDDSHTHGEMVAAAIRYAAHDLTTRVKLRTITARNWPWVTHWFKPSVVTERNLVKAGALIAAEIDRLKRRNPLSLESPR